MTESILRRWRPHMAGRQWHFSDAWRNLASSFLADRQRWWLWLPVAMGCGVASYFALSEEPDWTVCALMLTASLLHLAWQRWQEAPIGVYAATMLLAAALGFSAAYARTHLLAAPVVPYQGSFTIEGQVLLAEPRRGKQRILLENLEIEELDADETPHKVRVTLRKDAPFVAAGDRVAVRARLQPPGGPLLPGGFDYARQVWFQQLGGLGYAIGDLTLLDRSADAGLGVRINRLRQRIADAAVAAIDGPSAAVAAALLTALRAGIEEHVWRDMQLSGLAHLLAISGLHMGLVAGTVFLFVRYLVAFSFRLTLLWPAKKYAALAGLAASGFYLMLAGLTVPTTRAFIMTAVALLAIVWDRNPFSMRLVALAAGLILLFRPESLLGASFQMSFAAVIALIAFYESRSLAPDNREGSKGIEGWRLVRTYLLGVAVTTLIASLATSPLGAYHFQRVAAYGIAANLIGVPLTAFWIMPSGLLALAAMPFGLEQPFFWLMGQGIDWLLAIAATMAALPGAGLNAGQMPLAALLLFALGGLWLCLWRAKWRWWGTALWLAVIPVMLLHRPPDLVIERGGGMVAMRNPAGAYDLIRWRKDRYMSDNWQRALGGVPFGEMPEPGTGRQGRYACDASGCTAQFDKRRISIARNPAAAIEDCGRADIVIATRAVDRCRGGAELIGSRDLWLSQGMALWLNDDGVAVKTVVEERGQRPWAID